MSGTRRKKKRKKASGWKSLIICALVFLVLVIICVTGTIILYKESSEAPQITVDLEILDSPYAVLLDRKSGNSIGNKRSDEIIFPASMVKIITVWTAIEKIKNLNDTVVMDYGIYDTLYAANASMAGFEPGEEAVIKDLLYGALLPSGAECCMQLALTVAGSEAAFVELMNQKAVKLGLSQTHFTNCTGLHNDDQYSTVREIGIILNNALKNKTFYEVFTTRSYTVRATDIHPDGFTFQSSMFKGLSDSAVAGGEILGGKTGYTGEAGHCLASMAEIDDRQYILVTAGWAADPRVEQYHINDALLGYNALGHALGSE